MGRAWPHKPFPTSSSEYESRIVGWIHLRIFGSKNQIHLPVSAEFEIAIQITGIFFQILPNPKLGGVYENGKNDDVCPIPHQVDKRHMSIMQITHRRHQADRFALVPQLPGEGLHLVYGGKDLHDKIRSTG